MAVDDVEASQPVLALEHARRAAWRAHAGGVDPEPEVHPPVPHRRVHVQDGDGPDAVDGDRAPGHRRPVGRAVGHLDVDVVADVARPDHVRRSAGTRQGLVAAEPPVVRRGGAGRERRDVGGQRAAHDGVTRHGRLVLGHAAEHDPAEVFDAAGSGV